MKQLLFAFILLSALTSQAQTRNRVGINVTCTMYGNSLSMWQGIEQNVSATWAKTFRTDTVRFDTGTAMRVEVRRTDTIGSSGLVRSEIRDTPVVKNEKYYAVSIYVPAYTQPDPDQDIITQFHDIADVGEVSRNPCISLQAKAGHWFIDVWSDTAAISIPGIYSGHQSYQLDTIVQNKWFDFVWHIKYSYSSDGLIELWRNDRLIFRRSGPNCFNDSKYPYFKFGIYKPGWGYQPTVSPYSSRVYFFDEARTGTVANGAVYYSVSPYNLPDKYYPVKWVIKKP